MEEYQCPQEPRFYFTSCTIKTCKNWIKDGTTHCFELDVKKPIGDKIISDAELKLYKLSHKDVTLRQIAFDRQHAIDNVKHLILLYRYIDYIRESCNKSTIKVSKKSFKRLKHEYPFNIKKLGLESWILGYIHDIHTFSKFIKLKVGGIKETKLHEMLGLTEIQFENRLLQLKVRING